MVGKIPKKAMTMFFGSRRHVIHTFLLPSVRLPVHPSSRLDTSDSFITFQLSLRHKHEEDIQEKACWYGWVDLSTFVISFHFCCSSCCCCCDSCYWYFMTFVNIHWVGHQVMVVVTFVIVLCIILTVRDYFSAGSLS